MKSKTNRRQYILWVLALMFMTLSFYSNFWSACEDRWFDTFQRDNEAMVIGRLIATEEYGLSLGSGFTGRFKQTPEFTDTEYQYHVYFNGKEVLPDEFGTYISQSGGQAIVFSLIGKVLPLRNKDKYELFRLVSALLTSLVLVCFAKLIADRFGLFTGLFVVVASSFSMWLVVMSQFVWWSMWSFYLPFVALFWYLDREKHQKQVIANSGIFAIIFFTTIVKCWFNGFEFITASMIMSLVPIVFYAILAKWDLRKLILSSLLGTGAVFSGVLFSLGIMALQIAHLKGSVSNGIDHIIFSFQKRSAFARGGGFEGRQKEALQSELGDVLSGFWNREIIDLNHLFSGLPWRSIRFVQFSEVFWTTFICSLLLFIVAVFRKQAPVSSISSRRAVLSMILTTWVSILAPLSWFVIFKAHAFIHPFDTIVWHMPFLLFAYLQVGLLLTLLLDLIVSRVPFLRNMLN